MINNNISKNIYNFIADEFNKTRYNKWPGVINFLNSINENTILGDIGCGNGKYLNHKKDIHTIGVDTSDKLLNIKKLIMIQKMKFRFLL